jgi:hypothetical protein
MPPGDRRYRDQLGVTAAVGFGSDAVDRFVESNRYSKKSENEPYGAVGQ